MPSPVSKQQWLDWIYEQEQSHLSIAAFCRQKDIRADNFYYHRQQLRKTNLPDSTRFIRATSSSKSESGAGSEPIRLTCGRSCLTFPHNVSPQWLAALLVALA